VNEHDEFYNGVVQMFEWNWSPMSLFMKALLVMHVSFQNIVLFVLTFFEFVWDGVLVSL